MYKVQENGVGDIKAGFGLPTKREALNAALRHRMEEIMTLSHGNEDDEDLASIENAINTEKDSEFEKAANEWGFSAVQFRMKSVYMSLNFFITVPEDTDVTEATKVTFSDKGIHVHHNNGVSTVKDPGVEPYEEDIEDED